MKLKFARLSNRLFGDNLFGERTEWMKVDGNLNVGGLINLSGELWGLRDLGREI